MQPGRPTPPAPRLALTLAVVATAVFAAFAWRFRIDSSVDQLLPSDDADRLYHRGVQAAFGSEEVLLIALFAPDVFAPATLRCIGRLTDALERIDGVRRVSSLANLEAPLLDETGLGRRRLIPPPSQQVYDAPGLRAAALGHPLARGILLAPDARAAGIAVELEPMPDATFLARGTDGHIRAAVAAACAGEEVAITGLPTIKVHAAQAMLRDLGRFVPLGFITAGLVLALAHRTWRGLLLPLSTVLIGVIWTAGAMVLVGHPFGMGTLILPPLLVAVGLAYAIHVVSRYSQEVASSPSASIAARRTLEHVRIPVSMAAITTLAGFATFIGNRIPSIRHFGIYASFGIAVILGAALLVVPALLAVLPLRSAVARRSGERLSLPLRHASRLVLAHRRAVLWLTAALVAASALGLTRLRVETDYLGFFDPASAVRLDNTRIADALVGTQVVAIAIDGEGPGAAIRLDLLAALRELQAFVKRQPGVGKTVSLLDHLDMIRRAIEPEAAGEPLAEQAAVEQLLVLLDPEETRRTLSRDHARLNLTAYTRLSGSEEVRDFTRRVETFAAARFPSSVRVRATGAVVLLNRSADAVAAGQITGLLQVFVILLVLMIGLFRSLRLGALSMVPNVVPVVVLFGIMGWAGIDLNISTSMIAAMAIGIAVDDTIHYMTTFRAVLSAAGSREAAILETVRLVGQPIVVTSVALAAGFLIVCLSSFQPIRHFGILASVTMVVALIADLFLLPALLLTRFAAAGEPTAGRP